MSNRSAALHMNDRIEEQNPAPLEIARSEFPLETTRAEYVNALTLRHGERFLAQEKEPITSTNPTSHRIGDPEMRTRANFVNALKDRGYGNKITHALHTAQAEALPRSVDLARSAYVVALQERDLADTTSKDAIALKKIEAAKRAFVNCMSEANMDESTQAFALTDAQNQVSISDKGGRGF